jgi:hypothetical protein
MNDLSIKHGYYFAIDRDDVNMRFHVDVGKGYINDDVKNITITQENGFIKLYINGELSSSRDTSVTPPYSDVIDSYIKNMVDEFTQSALVKRSGESFIPYFDN